MIIKRAVLVKRRSDDGLIEVQDDIPLGTVYHVDVSQISDWPMRNLGTGRRHVTRFVACVDVDAEGAMPLELLEIEP